MGLADHLEQFHSYLYPVAAVAKPSGGVVCGNGGDGLSGGLLQGFHQPGLGRTQQLFDLRPSLLDGIEVRRVGRQIEQLRPASLDQLSHSCHTLCAARLSITTTWPGGSRGPKTCSREAKKTSPSVGDSM